MLKRSDRKSRRRPVQEEVELNMAAMLDMAFQLLAFFILTFNPSEVEVQIGMIMPPDGPVVKASGTISNDAPLLTEDSVGFPIAISLYSSPNGELREIQLAGQTIKGDSVSSIIDEFSKQLSVMLRTPGFDSIDMKVDELLGYEQVIRVFDVCTSQTLPNGDRLTKLSINLIP